MGFSKRLFEIRTEKKMTREKLGKLIQTSGAIIGKYERDERTPSVEIARKIAKVLEVSLDFLVGNIDYRLDMDILNKIQRIQRLPENDKDHLFYLVDTILQNVDAKQVFTK